MKTYSLKFTGDGSRYLRAKTKDGTQIGPFCLSGMLLELDPLADIERDTINTLVVHVTPNPTGQYALVERDLESDDYQYGETHYIAEGSREVVILNHREIALLKRRNLTRFDMAIAEVE